MIRALQVKAFTSIQLAPTLSAIAAEGRGILDDLYLRPAGPGPSCRGALPPLHRTITSPHQQAILQQVDVPRLTGRRPRGHRAARQHRRHPPGRRRGRRPARWRGDRRGRTRRAGDRAGTHLPPGSAVRLPAAGRHQPAGPVTRGQRSGHRRSGTRHHAGRSWSPGDAGPSRRRDGRRVRRVPGSSWPCRPGTTTCGPAWTTSSSRRPGRPWCCYEPGACMGGLLEYRRHSAGRRSRGASSTPKISWPATSRPSGKTRAGQTQDELSERIRLAMGLSPPGRAHWCAGSPGDVSAPAAG